MSVPAILEEVLPPLGAGVCANPGRDARSVDGIGMPFAALPLADPDDLLFGVRIVGPASGEVSMVGIGYMLACACVVCAWPTPRCAGNLVAC